MLTPEDVQEIKNDVEFCTQQLETGDMEAIKQAIQRLESSRHRIAEAMYAEASETKQ